MGLFGKSTSKQTAKVKSLVKLTAARLPVARRPCLGRRSVARGDVGQLLAIGRLDRALLRAEQVIDECNMLEVLDTIDLYCKIIIEQAPQLDNPKECSEEIKASAAGLMFASARLGELPELLDARGILADKFGWDFARAAKEGSHAVVDPKLVKKLSGARASEEEKRRLAKEIAAENYILLDFPDENPIQIRQHAPVQPKQSVPIKSTPVKEFVQQNVPIKNAQVKEFVQQSEVKAGRREVQRMQRFLDDAARTGLAQSSLVDEVVLRESKKCTDTRMAAEAAFQSASFAAMAARAAVELSRAQTQGKGPRGGFDKVHAQPVQGHTRKPPSPSWSGGSTLTSVGSNAAQKGKSVAFDRRDDEEEDVVWPPRRPAYQRAASVMGTGGGGAWHGEAGKNGIAGSRPFQDAAPGRNTTQRRHATELTGGNHKFHDAPAGQHVTPPYRRTPTGTTTTARERDAYESSAHAHPQYARILSALGGGKNEHIARHEAVHPMGTDARMMQERAYGATPPVQGHAPMNTERRANSVRTRR